MNMGAGYSRHLSAIRNMLWQPARAGASIATIPPAVLDLMFKHPLTDKGLGMPFWRTGKR